MSTQRYTLAFVGAGNMARSLIGGLLADGHPPQQLVACDPAPEARAWLAERGVTAVADAAALPPAEAYVLAVKPQHLPAVARRLGALLEARRALVLSIAAGVRLASLARWLSGPQDLVRAMPNTPALVQAGISALYAAPTVAREQRELAESIMRAAGDVVWVDHEAALDAVTAVSGSGPAYVFLLMEALAQGGRALGLPAAVAERLALQTVFGAAKLALETEQPPGRLREQVTSPGGTTESALAVLREGGLVELFARALTAARDRAVELGEQLDRLDPETGASR